MIDTLKEAKKRLESVSGVKSLKIGLEPQISPSEYPLIRLVGGKTTLQNHHGLAQNHSFSVYCGDKLDDKIGLEKIYEIVYALEREIKVNLHNKTFKNDALVRYESTVADEDRLPNFKVLCLNFIANGAKLKIIDKGENMIELELRVDELAKVIDSLKNSLGDYALKAKLGDYALKSELPNLDGYVTKGELNQKIAGVFVYKGSVAKVRDLPSENNKTGDVYNAYSTGANYAWNGTSWDKLSETIDLSGYALKTELPTDFYSRGEVDEKLSTKSDKLDIKQYELILSSGVVLGSGLEPQQSETFRKKVTIYGKLCVVDFDFMASSPLRVIATLPTGVPSPNTFKEVQLFDGSTIWIEANSNEIKANIRADTRYTASLMYFI